MTELSLVNVVFTLGLMAITGGFAFITKKVGAIAVWGFVSIFMVISLNFGYQFDLVMGLTVISFLMSIIALVIDG